MPSVANHSPTMTNVALVKVVSAFFGIDSIIICPGQNITDNDLNVWSALANEVDIGFHVYPEGTLLNPETFHEDMVLTYLDDEGCFNGIVDAVGLMSNAVWLVPDYLNVSVSDYLRLDSNWITFSQGFPNDTMELFEHYGISHEKIFDQKIGTFSETSGLDITDGEIWSRRNNLEGINLINTVNPYSPVATFVDEHHVLDGFMPEVLKTIQSRMNFTVTNLRPPDREWGVEKMYENGTKYWSGLVGELVAKRADMSVSGLTVKAERGRAIDYTIGVLPETLTLNIGTQSISTSNINAMAFIKCLEPKTWSVFLALAALYGVCHCIAELAKNEDHYKLKLKYMYGFIVVGKVFLKLPVMLGNWFSQKVMYMMAFFMCLMVFEGYIAQLTAEMTVGKPKVHLKSFQDVIDNEMTIFLTKGTVADLYFASAPAGSTRYIINQHHIDREKKTGLTLADVAVEVDKDPKLAFFESAIDFVKYDHVTSLLDFDGRINAVIGIGLQKNSELKAAFDFHIINMKQSGLLHEMYNNWIENDRPEDMSDRIFEEDMLVLGYDNLFLPANIMGLGIIIAMVIVTCEKLSFGKKIQSSIRCMSSLSDVKVVNFKSGNSNIPLSGVFSRMKQ